jgi:prephenate dehydrogenase
MIKRITIIGLGLIGGSLALAIKKRWPSVITIGIDRNQESLEFAFDNGLIDVVGGALLDVQWADVDMVIMAVPSVVLTEILIAFASLPVREDILFTDVGSTKRRVIDIFQQYLPEHFPYFVAAHPIAGSEKNNIQHAQATLFRQKKVVLCPHDQQEPTAWDRIKNFWTEIGLQVVILEAMMHDQLLAMTSHFPHLLSYVFMHQISSSELKNDYLQIAGSGFRDFSRIAAGEANLWADICCDNRDFLLPLLDTYQQELEQVRHYLLHKEPLALSEYFSQSRKTRQSWREEDTIRYNSASQCHDD